jgi:hypothetical protein
MKPRSSKPSTRSTETPISRACGSSRVGSSIAKYASSRGSASTDGAPPDAGPALSVVQLSTSAVPTPEALAAAERFAALVVGEIKLYNDAAIKMGRKKRDLRTRLHAEIDRARGLFRERMGSVPGHEGIFERELVRVLAGGDAELLGKPHAEAV